MVRNVQKKLVWLPLVSMLLVLLIAPPQVFPVAADKTVGLSPRFHNPVIIEPDTFWAGNIVAYSQGDEDLTCYITIQGIVFPWMFEWQFPPPQNWTETHEIPIPAGESRQGRFNITIPGNIKQGVFYNWSFVVGYLDYAPDTHAVAAAGSRVSMIYPKSPSILIRLMTFLGANKWLPFGIGVIVIAGVFKKKYYHRIRTFLDQEPWDVRKSREKNT
jgi:hypothetical protein